MYSLWEWGIHGRIYLIIKNQTVIKPNITFMFLVCNPLQSFEGKKSDVVYTVVSFKPLWECEAVGHLYRILLQKTDKWQTFRFIEDSIWGIEQPAVSWQRHLKVVCAMGKKLQWHIQTENITSNPVLTVIDNTCVCVCVYCNTGTRAVFSSTLLFTKSCLFHFYRMYRWKKCIESSGLSFAITRV